MTFLGHFSAHLKADLQSTRMKSTTRDDGKNRIEAGRRVRFVHASIGIRRRVRERRVAVGTSAGYWEALLSRPKPGRKRLVRFDSCATWKMRCRISMPVESLTTTLSTPTPGFTSSPWGENVGSSSSSSGKQTLSGRFRLTVQPRRRRNFEGALAHTTSCLPSTTRPSPRTVNGSCSSPTTVIQSPAGARRDAPLRMASILSIFSGPRIMRSPVRLTVVDDSDVSG